MTPKELFEDWIQIPEARAYLQSPEYEARVNQLGDLLEEGEMTVQDAADLVGVPVGPWIWILSNYLAAQAVRKKLN